MDKNAVPDRKSGPLDSKNSKKDEYNKKSSKATAHMICLSGNVKSRLDLKDWNECESL